MVVLLFCIEVFSFILSQAQQLQNIFPSVLPGEDITDKEEKIERKVIPKPRVPSKRAAGNKLSSQSDTGSAVNTSKYFESPIMEENDSEDDFDMVTSPPRLLKVNTKKPEKEEEVGEDSEEEDEDDWEEVEGKCKIGNIYDYAFHVFCLFCFVFYPYAKQGAIENKGNELCVCVIRAS